MSNVSSGRIAKNTLMLYVRMVIILGVSLYTSRVILEVLGIDDYGLYSLIAGILTLFSFISQSFIEATQRFFNVAIGRGETARQGSVYVMSVNIFLLFSLFLLLVGETLGIWYLHHYLNVPAGRENAAFWVYQISLLTLIVQFFRIPDNALIISYEKMSFYAWSSILEAVLKLLIVYALTVFHADKLILYVLLYLVTTLVINLIYRVHCRRAFPFCRYRPLWDAELGREMMKFSGWTMLNSGTRTVTLQLENIFLNRFYSVAVNAARGVASQVYNAVNQFITNFQTAFRPQLIKTYAAGEQKEHIQLLYESSKISFCLFLVVVIPVIYNLEALLTVWLVEVPAYTREFCVYVLIAYLADALAHPLTTSIMANGNIKGIQVTTSLVFVIQLLASYLSLKAGWPPYIVSVYIMVSHTIHYFLYLYYACRLCGVSLGDYGRRVLLPLLCVSVLSLLPPHFLAPFSRDFLSALLLCLTDALWVLAVVWRVGLNRRERSYIRQRLVACFRHN